MDIEQTVDLNCIFGREATLPYLVELKTPAGLLGFVIAHADTQDDARALMDAQLGRDDANDDVVIVAVHTIQ